MRIDKDLQLPSLVSASPRSRWRFATAVALMCSVAGTAIFFSLRSTSEKFRETGAEGGAGPTPSSPVTSAERSRTRASAKTLLDRNTKAALIASPLTAEGVNENAKNYFKLGQEDVDRIQRLLDDTRKEIGDKILAGLQSQPQEDGTIQFVCSPQKEVEDINSGFLQKLSELAGPEFADASADVLEKDHRFMGAGRRKVVISTIRNENTDEINLNRVRLEIFTPDELQARTWEGTPKTLRESYWIDFDPSHPEN